MSSVDIDQESNIQQSSRLFGSTSDLVNYPVGSPILNDSVVDSSKEIRKEIQIPFDSTNNDTIYENNKKPEINEESKKKILDLFDEDSDLFKSTQEKAEKKYDSYNDKKNILDEKLLESNLAHENVSDIVQISVHEQNLKIESTYQKHSKIEHINEKQLEKSEEQIKTETLSEIQSICDKEVLASDVNKLEKNLSKLTIQNEKLSKKSNSLFDDDEDDIFSSKPDKLKGTSSNIFDSNDEFDFKQKFTKNKSIKSIFDDESDDDLFSISSNPISNLPSKKLPIG